jgi:hypothetical protein
LFICKNYLIKFNDQTIGVVSSLKNSIKKTEVGFSARGMVMFDLILNAKQDSWIQDITNSSTQHLPIQIFIQDKNDFAIAKLENCWLKNEHYVCSSSGNDWCIYENANFEFDNFLKVI